MNNGAIHVLLADDHTLFRAGLRALLSELEGVVVVAEAADGAEALRLIAEHQPHIALVDVGMGAVSGLDVAAQVTVNRPDVRVIICSMYAHEEYVLRAMRAGAAGYLLKDADVVELGLAIKAALRGEIYLSAAVSKQLVAGYIQRTGAGSGALDGLSARQRETLRLIAEGRTTQEIANELGISVKTVEKHRSQLMERLGIRDIAGLVRFAIRVGLVVPDL
jgi:DNA-binding NarL/FixJ family response regulator